MKGQATHTFNIETQFELWFRCETYLQVLFNILFISEFEVCGRLKNENVHLNYVIEQARTLLLCCEVVLDQALRHRGGLIVKSRVQS